MSRTLPVPKDVKDLLEELLGRTVTVSPGEPFRAVDLGKLLLISIYVDDHLKMKAVIGMDLPLAVYAGAAIGLIPVAGAETCIEERQLTAMIAENVTEVCNILTSLLNHEGQDRLRMYKTFLPGGDEKPPTDAVGYLLAHGRRLDLNVDVQGYGEGRIAVTLAN